MSGGKTINIIFFGDSICFGYGVSPHLSWVGQLSKRLEEFGARHGADIVVTNTAVNGNTTRLALERMPYDVQSHPCDILYIQFGMNDCNYWQSDKGVPRVSPQAFEANLHEIINRARAFGARRIFINTNHPSARLTEMPPSRVRYQSSSAEYNKIIRRVAQDSGVILNDIERAFEDSFKKKGMSVKDMVLNDEIHLNAAGHKIYINIVAPTIEAAALELIK